MARLLSFTAPPAPVLAAYTTQRRHQRSGRAA